MPHLLDALLPQKLQDPGPVETAADANGRQCGPIRPAPHSKPTDRYWFDMNQSESPDAGIGASTEPILRKPLY